MILPVHTGSGSYEIVIERGSLSRAGEFLELYRRVLIVTDEGVPEEYAATLAARCAAPHTVRVPRGEGAKTLQTLEGLLRTMLQKGFTRADCVCAVGGGMVGDLAGFAAAVYMRGVDFYNIPTTLLSQADSCLGGKTGVNLDGVKNAVGAFYPPKKVLIDVNTLTTLPPRQLASGMAEAVKAGLIRDAALFALFEGEDPADHPEQIVTAALRVKKSVVELDEKELGLRRILNFGHTVGHAVESVTGLYHGECVGLGMLPMCAGPVRQRLRAVLERLGLPTTVKADPERVYQAMLHDKKAGADGRITVVRVPVVGECFLAAAEPETLRPLIETVVQP